MSQALGEIAVICEKEESFGLGVEPANVEKARKLGGQEIKNRVARIGIGSSGNEAGRLIQDDVELLLALDQFAPHFHVVAFRRLGAEIGANATVDGDTSVGDQLVAVPPRTDASGGEKAIETHGGEVGAENR